MYEARTAKRKSSLSAAQFTEREEDDIHYTQVHHNSCETSLSSDLTKRPHIELFVTNHEPVQTKRKQSQLDESAGLTEQIKRFRITNTPGELRMQKDLKELYGRNDVSFQYPEEPGSVIISFVTDPFLPFIPTIFRINIPRFYPHNAPEVYCLDEEYSSRGRFICPHILSTTGEISHDGLGESWSAIGSLTTVIDILQNIRIMIQQNPQLRLQTSPTSFHTSNGHTSSSSSSSDMHINDGHSNGIPLVDETNNEYQMMQMMSDSVTQVEYYVATTGVSPHHYMMDDDLGSGGGSYHEEPLHGSDTYGMGMSIIGDPMTDVEDTEPLTDLLPMSTIDHGPP